MRTVHGQSLAELTSIRIGGTAAEFFMPETAGELAALLRERRDAVVVGGGSNLVLGDFSRRAVVGLRRLAGPEPECRECPDRPGRVAVDVGAGRTLAGAAAWAADRGLTGLENLAGIPGTVGGALVMNAGTPRGCFGEAVRAATVLTPAGEIITVSAALLHFSYRFSALQSGGALAGAVALAVTLELTPGGTPEAIRETMRTVRAGRASERIRLPNCGSVFRNPPGGSAGKLLEEAGMKGETAGALRVSPVHANFFENTGGAVYADFVTLLERARRRVREASGVELEPEVKVISD